jgi:hypothetical protein
LVRHIRRGQYGDWPPLLADGTILLVALFHVGLMALAVVGWLHGPGGAARSLTWVVVGYVIAVHVLTFAMSRFRLPLEPLLAVGAGLALAAPLQVAAGLGAGHRRWLTLILLLALTAGWGARAGGLFYVVPPGSPPPDLGGGPGD